MFEFLKKKKCGFCARAGEELQEVVRRDYFDWYRPARHYYFHTGCLLNALRNATDRKTIDIDEGESPVEAAKREVEEETGYKVTNLELLGQWYMEVELFDWATVMQMVKRNEIKQPHTVLALLLLDSKMRESNAQ